MKIVIKPLSDTEWDVYRIPMGSRCRDIDAHLRKEMGIWILHIFDSYIERDSDAYLEDIEINRCPTGPNWNQVIIAMTEYEK